MTGRLAAGLVVSAMAIAPGAASAKTGSVFNFSRATGSMRVTYSGDSAASCERFGTCGWSGTVTYRVGGKPKGTLVLARGSHGRVSGGASYRTTATTVASVTPPAGGKPCSATVKHRTDMFSAASLKGSIKALVLSYDVAGTDILATSCPGPTEKDAAAAGALPEGTFQASGFQGRKLRWGMSGGLPFTGSGFSAEAKFDFKYKAAGRSCNPRCAIPAHRAR